MNNSLAEKNVTVVIYSDGACSGNPGPGGWGALLQWGGTEKEICGGVAHTTNNRMELQAVIEALGKLKKPCTVEVYTDSRYVQQGIQTWIHRWIKNDWKTSDKKPVRNQDLWQKLYEYTHTHRIEWQWVKGHSGHAENDRVDQLARRGMTQAIAETSH